MPIDAGIELAGLSHWLADRAVAVDVVHRHVARVVVGGEEIFAGRADAGIEKALCGHVLTPGIFAAATASANTAVAAQRLITVLGTNRGDETRFHGRISITCWRSNRGSHAS